MNELKTYRTIKLETLEKRFEKLHSAANNAEECAKAIVFHAGRLSLETEEFQKMSDAVCEWRGKFARLGTTMQRAENIYYEHFMNDGKDCELVEDVPNFKRLSIAIPSTYQIDAKLFEIGYYELEGDPYAVSKHVFTTEEIIGDIQFLLNHMTYFVKALFNAEYKGIWKDSGAIVCEIFETMPDTVISDMLHETLLSQQAR